MKKEEEKRLSYLPISNQVIREALDEQKIEQLKELGISGGVIFMIDQGYAKQLRSDIFEILSQVLNLDISPKLESLLTE